MKIGLYVFGKKEVFGKINFRVKFLEFEQGNKVVKLRLEALLKTILKAYFE